MPMYTWGCRPCGRLWDVASTVAERDHPQACAKCQAEGERQLTLPNLDKTSAGSWNQQSYNPGLGCWTQSTKHAEQIAKSRGLEPIGNEPPENLHKMAEKTKAETREQRWRDADRQMLYD
jgi:putative FmdB family regulatory protein